MSYTFKNIKVWQKAHELVLEIYKITKNFPSSEKYGLTAQLRRAAVSFIIFYLVIKRGWWRHNFA
ncbi:MAG: four helix bundle protein [Candidatus Omnitrophica bacterium]|nr:four helix bundle protein [Candidatus Omnitrophota bacterium]MBU4467890.1 four helix bundle protein [Candidatus Omnitrophota bacterium]